MSDESSTYVCIACPVGCPLRLVHEGGEIREVTGQKCNRGAKYAHQEFTDPRRTFATTVPITGALYARCPVKLSAAIPKDKVLEAARAIHRLSLQAPVSCGDIVEQNLLGLTDVHVVVTRTMKRLLSTLPNRRNPSP